LAGPMRCMRAHASAKERGKIEKQQKKQRGSVQDSLFWQAWCSVHYKRKRARGIKKQQGCYRQSESESESVGYSRAWARGHSRYCA